MCWELSAYLLAHNWGLLDNFGTRLILLWGLLAVYLGAFLFSQDLVWKVKYCIKSNSENIKAWLVSKLRFKVAKSKFCMANDNKTLESLTCFPFTLIFLSLLNVGSLIDLYHGCSCSRMAVFQDLLRPSLRAHPYKIAHNDGHLIRLSLRGKPLRSPPL